MAKYLDSVPLSGIIRIRDLMFTIKDPFRLDQGDVSFDAPDSVKEAMIRAVRENRSHYVQTAGIPPLLQLLADKLRSKNHIPIGSPDEIMVTTGGIHAIFMVCQALLEPGDEIIVPDPTWPPTVSNILGAHGVPLRCSIHERIGWRYDMDELAATVTPRTRAIYINSPHNPTGGVLSRNDLEQIAALAERHNLWVVSDEAYEDVLFDGEQHVSIASLPGMYERTVPIYTFSKTYAMTGLRLGYTACRNQTLRDRMKKMLFLTASNIASVVQYGGIGALEGSQEIVEQFRVELEARRGLFYDGVRELNGVLSGDPPKGAFYGFLRIDPSWQPDEPSDDPSIRGSISWQMVEHLVKRGRIGCVPGVDFGPAGEGYIRFCFARERKELTGALESMKALFASSSVKA